MIALQKIESNEAFLSSFYLFTLFLKGGRRGETTGQKITRGRDPGQQDYRAIIISGGHPHAPPGASSTKSYRCGIIFFKQLLSFIIEFRCTTRSCLCCVSPFHLLVVGEGKRQRFASGRRHGSQIVDAGRSALAARPPRKRRAVRPGQLNNNNNNLILYHLHTFSFVTKKKQLPCIVFSVCGILIFRSSWSSFGLSIETISFPSAI